MVVRYKYRFDPVAVITAHVAPKQIERWGPELRFETDVEMTANQTTALEAELRQIGYVPSDALWPDEEEAK